MKNLLKLMLFAGIIAFNSTFAQKVDSTQTKNDSTKKADYFSKYKKTPSNTAPKINESWKTKPEEKKVESSYQTENGRTTGGKTTLKLGKKN